MPRLTDAKGFLPYVVIVFLNAFVDLGHKIVVQNTVFKIYDGQTQIILTAIVNALILIPFILLFSPAGFLSDKYPKNKVMRYSAWIAVAATLLITACYYAGWFRAAFALTLVLAVQSAIYGPAKYGYIKELVGNENLARANGVVQATSIAGILLGTFVFSGLFEALLYKVTITDPGKVMQDIAPIGWILVALSVFELVLTYKVPQKTQTYHGNRFVFSDYIKLRYMKNNLRIISHKQTIWLSIIGLSTFWAISQVVLASFPAFAKAKLEETNTLVIQGILACSGIGIILGSIIAGRVSRAYIEIGLIPLGAIGLAACLAWIPTLESQFAMGVAFIGLGTMGGLFIVPLNALIQYHAKEHEIGTVLAGNNWVQNVGMLTFLVLTVAFAIAGFGGKALFMFLTAIALLGSGYTIKKLPHSLARIVVSVFFRGRYNIEVNGFKNLPAEGPVLLLGNHVSWIDWALVQIASPRPLRFVIQREIYNRWFLQPILKLFGVIPIAKGQSAASLKSINEQLRRGEAVCLFPEGAISRNGQLGKFYSGYERTVDGVDNGVILPFYLRGLWGSAFSRSSDKLRDTRAPKSMRRDIIVSFGKPLSISTPTEILKQKVFELSISAWKQYTNTLDTISLAWIRTAKRNGSRICAVEADGQRLSYRRMLTATIVFANAIRRCSQKHGSEKYSQEQNIGIVLPSSTANIIANMAIMFNGQTAVNLNYTSGIEAVRAGIVRAQIRTVYSSKKFTEKLQQRGIDMDAILSDISVVYMEDIKVATSFTQLVVSFLKTLLPATVIYHLFAHPRALDDPAAILFSSGSEGVPKGIVLSHRNIVANCKQISDVLNTQDDDVIVGSLPPFHCFGLTVTCIMPILEGIPVICHPDPTDVLAIAKTIARHHATILCATATFLRLYAKNQKVEPLMLGSLRIVVAGAEKLNQITRNTFERKFNKIIYEGYGTTETTPVASVNIPDAIDTTYWRVQHGNRSGSVGLPLPGSAFLIVDPDSLKPLPLEEEGLVLVSGTQVMLGYLHDEKKTAEVMVELNGRRWYKTGDKGRLTNEGFLTIVDRYSRFAKIGGEMVSLGAIEERVREILHDEEINLVAISLADQKKGEKVVLLVEGQHDTDQIRRQLLDGGMENLMLPAVIDSVAYIPKLGSGKIDYGAAAKLAEPAA